MMGDDKYLTDDDRAIMRTLAATNSDRRSRVIPEAAVTVAAKVLYADKMSNHSGDNAPQIIDACEKVARKILEAAAPHMLNLAKREAWDANLEIQRLRAELAKFEALRPYTIEDQRQHGETW